MSSEQTVALGELRAARRRRFVEQLDVMEVLYRVYLAAIFGGIALAVVAISPFAPPLRLRLAYDGPPEPEALAGFFER